MQMKLMMPERATLNNIEADGALLLGCMSFSIIRALRRLPQASMLNMARARKDGTGATNLPRPQRGFRGLLTLVVLAFVVWAPGCGCH